MMSFYYELDLSKLPWTAAHIFVIIKHHLTLKTKRKTIIVSRSRALGAVHYSGVRVVLKKLSKKLAGMGAVGAPGTTGEGGCGLSQGSVGNPQIKFGWWIFSVTPQHTHEHGCGIQSSKKDEYCVADVIGQVTESRWPSLQKKNAVVQDRF